MAAQQLGRLGFVGCGTIVSAVVEGLCTLPAASRAAHLCAGPLLLAPRGQSQRLRTAHGPKVEVAADNQAVLDASDTVVMGLTPQHARAALAPLRFRAGTVVVSLMHGVSPAALLALPASPPGTVVRVNPLPGVAHHSGIAAVWPPHAAVASLFGLLGAVTETAELDAFHAMHAATTVGFKKDARPSGFLPQKVYASVFDRNRFAQRRGVSLTFEPLDVLWAKLHGEVAAAVSARVARIPLVWEPKHRERKRFAHYP